MNRGERRRQERATANGRLLPEEKEHIRDQQRLPADQPLSKQTPTRFSQSPTDRPNPSASNISVSWKDNA